MSDFFCPIPLDNTERITLAHGAGGKTMHDLIEKTIRPLFSQGFTPDHDGAVFNFSGTLAFTSDSYVVKPLFFPGGDIGKLAVYGTVNDLAMCGAKPMYLSCSFILEEGLPLAILQQVCTSIAEAARVAEVAIVTGDTKVVGKGQTDGIFVNTSGVGSVLDGVSIHPKHVRAGDVLVLSGDLGRHGIAVMSARENFGISGDLASDCAPLSEPVQALLEAGVRPRCLRDLTRGGLAASLHEICSVGLVGMEIEEARISVHASVRGACEILGLDPLYIANEGRFLAVVAPEEADKAVSTMRRYSASADAVIIGTVNGMRDVEVVNAFGTRRILPALQGELLPRIC